MTEASLLEAAVDRFGSKQNLAKALGVAPQTVSDWGKVRSRGGVEYVVPIPRAHKRMLRVLLGLPEDEDGRIEPWQDPEWRRSRQQHKATEQVKRLFIKTGGRGRDWEMVTSVLDYATPWLERDWRELYALETVPPDDSGEGDHTQAVGS